MVVPSSAYEEEQLKMLVPSSNPYPTLWIGVNDLRKYRHFVKESNGEPLTYSNWRQAAPADSKKHRGRSHCTAMPMVQTMSFLLAKNLNPATTNDFKSCS